MIDKIVYGFLQVYEGTGWTGIGVYLGFVSMICTCVFMITFAIGSATYACFLANSFWKYIKQRSKQ